MAVYKITGNDTVAFANDLDTAQAIADHTPSGTVHKLNRLHAYLHTMSKWDVCSHTLVVCAVVGALVFEVWKKPEIGGSRAVYLCIAFLWSAVGLRVVEFISFLIPFVRNRRFPKR